MIEKLKTFKTEDEFLIEFSNEDSVHSRLLSVISAASSEDKIFQRALHQLKSYILDNVGTIVKFHNELMHLRSEYLERLEERIPVSKWNVISDMISSLNTKTS